MTVTPAAADGGQRPTGARVTIESSAGNWQDGVENRQDGTYVRTLVAPTAPALAVIRLTIDGTPLLVYPRVRFQ